MQWLLLVVLAFGPGLSPQRAAATAQLNLGVQRAQRHDLDGATKAVEQAIELNPELGRAHLTLGQIRRRRGQLRSALEAFEAGMKVAAGDAALQAKLSYQIGATHLEQAEEADVSTEERRTFLQSAANALKHAIESNPKDFRAHHRRARAFDRLGEPKQADLHYRKCIELQPRYDRCFVDLGTMYIDYGYANVGIAVLEAGVEVNDESATMWGGLGRAYSMLGRPADAVDSLKKAKAIDPNDSMVRFSLGMAYAELNDRKNGVEELQAYLKYAGTDEPDVRKKAAQNTIARLQDVI